MSLSRFKRRVAESLPPVPDFRSPARLWRWIKARPRRLRNFKVLVVMLLLAAAIGVAARPVAHQVKAWQARRLAGEATQLIEKEDWKNASRKIQDALRIWPNELEAWRAEARLLSQVGQNQEALKWWQRVSDSGPLSISD